MRIHKLEQELAEAKETIACFEAMKEGVGIRIADLNQELVKTKKQLELFVATTKLVYVERDKLRAVVEALKTVG